MAFSFCLNFSSEDLIWTIEYGHLPGKVLLDSTSFNKVHIYGFVLRFEDI